MKTLRDLQNNPGQLSGVEKIKFDSNFLRGTIDESLIDEITGSISENDMQISKFHGIYQQTDLILTTERKKQKLEPYYMFMVRVRVPGGISTAGQWLEMDRLSDLYGNKTIKITTRQAYQFHGILKRNLKQHIRLINEALLDTIAACGDVNRNVMCSPNPNQSAVHQEVDEFARKVSEHLTPSTRAYHELWLEDNLVNRGASHSDDESIYGKLYLPRKFKIAFAIPPYNDTDVFTNDIGLIAIERNGSLAGFNIVLGGGMGNTFGDAETYPKLGDTIGFCTPEQLVSVIENIVKIQRDYGNRENRKIARLKYTVDRKGVEWFRQELKSRSGITLEKQKPYEFKHNSDIYGWTKDIAGKWHYTLFVENGRVHDTEELKMKSCLREIARMEISDFRLTGNQNIIFGDISASNKEKLQEILEKYNLNNSKLTGLRLNSLACVALNTCPLAFSEAETYLPDLIDKIDEITLSHGISKEGISIRMTGCPNGCARPYNAEIAFVGRAPGIYNMYLGGNSEGSRLNRLYKEMLKEKEILTELRGIIEDFAINNSKALGFGDFIWEKGYVTNDIPLNL